LLSSPGDVRGKRRRRHEGTACLAKGWNVTCTVADGRKWELLEAERFSKPGQADPFVNSSVYEIDVAWRDPEGQVGESMSVEQGSRVDACDWPRPVVRNVADSDRFRVR
jgi:hypothetical protein